MFSFTSRPLYPRGKSSQYSIDSSLEGGGVSEEGCAAGLDAGKEKNLLEYRRKRGRWILGSQIVKTGGRLELVRYHIQ